jgi:uncharacterized protein (DUF427 family)
VDPPGAAGGRLAILGYVVLYQDAMNKWLEEDEEVFGHPHDSYHRVDVLESSRHVKVSLNGEVVAETGRPKILFETGLPSRYYIPPEDVVWYYPEPLPEAGKVKDHLCFYDEKVDLQGEG